MKEEVITMQAALKFILDYCKNILWEKIKEAGLRLFEKFKKAIWEEVKKELKEIAKQAITDVETYCDSLYATKREEAIINRVMEQIKLPFFLKPFKGLIKSMLKSKIEEFVKEAIKRSKEFVA